MAREALQLTPETTWGVYNTSGTPQHIQLTDSNQFTLRPAWLNWEIRGACSYNRRSMRGSTKYTLTGTLNNIIVFGSQGPFWAQALTLVGTDPPTLPSFTIDHFIQMEDAANTKVYRRYLGCKISQATWTCNSDGQLMRLSVNLTGKATATITAIDFPDPACSSYPTDPPYVIQHATGIVMGTAGTRTEFDQFNVVIANLMDATFFNSPNITRLKFCGRNVDGSLTFPYITTMDRSDYEGQTAKPASCVFTNGTHSLTFNFENVNYTSAVSDQLDYNRVFLQGVSFQNYYDPATSNDFLLTAT